MQSILGPPVAVPAAFVFSGFHPAVVSECCLAAGIFFIIVGGAMDRTQLISVATSPFDPART
jgi:hypothetical protein